MVVISMSTRPDPGKIAVVAAVDVADTAAIAVVAVVAVAVATVVAADAADTAADAILAAATTARLAGKTKAVNQRLFTQSAPGSNTVRQGRLILSTQLCYLGISSRPTA